MPRLLLPLAKALNPGERWITIHGGDGNGQPVLIQEHPDHSATVIGGAGGKLNHLKLRGIKPQSEYKAQVAESQHERKASKKAADARDRELGIYEAKQSARAALRAELTEHRRNFVAAVAKLSGWTPESIMFDEAAHAGLSEAALAKARVNFEHEVYRKAKQEVDVNRQRLLIDADARAASGLGEVPLLAPSPEQLSVTDLDPMPEKVAGLGFAPGYKERAALSPSDLQAEVAELEHKPPQAVAKAEAKVATAQAIANELKAFAAENPDTPKPPNPKLLEDAKHAADLVRAMKKLRLAEQKAKVAAAELDASTKAVEPKAFVLEVSDTDIDTAARKAIEDDVRTAGVRAFLSEVGKSGGERSLGGHVVAGAFNALNAAAGAIAGDSLIDRSVADVLGVAGAAAVLARRFRGDLSPEDAEKARHAIEDWHVAHSSDLQTTTLAQAQKLHDAAAAIEVPEATTGMDLAAAQEINDRRRRVVNEAKSLVGHALGELQAEAALVAAMQGATPKKVDVSLGAIAPESAIIQLRALGLQKGDYAIEHAGGNLLVTVNADGMDRIARPVDRDGMAQIRRNLDIIEGKYDEAEWLPQGFASRPDLATNAEPGVAPRLALPFEAGDKTSDTLTVSLRDYIGGRWADGDNPHDIAADIESPKFFEKAGDATAYRTALDAVAPKGQALEALFDKYADAFVDKHYGSERTPLNRQSIATDKTSIESLHRALAAVPDGVAAMKPIAELTPQERNGLRKWWSAHKPTTVPDWKSLVQSSGSPEAAIAGVQELVRSHLVERFVDSYNRLQPHSPLRLGKIGMGFKWDSNEIQSNPDSTAAAHPGELKQSERYTAGHIVEQKLAAMMSVVGQNFRPGQPVRLWQPSMSGGKNAPRQRLIKMLVANKRVLAAFGTGAGKAALSLAGYTQLHELGKVKRGLFVVPAVVQGQLGAEALRYLEPGKYKWSADPGASRAQRLAAYKDPAQNFVVVTHQAFRDDLLYLGAQQAGIEPSLMAQQLQQQTPTQRNAWAKAAMDKAGMAFEYMNLDEAQYTLNRKGKENSRMADVIDAVAANVPYYMPTTADPVKNDASEIFDELHVLDGQRYKDQAAFLRKYGGDTVAAKDALRREMARYIYPSRIDPDTKADRQQITVPLNGEQRAAMVGLNRNLSRMRVARMGGKIDVDAARAVSPSSFEGVAPEQHEAVAKALQQSLGMVKDAAIRRVINAHPASAKADEVIAYADARKGKPGVVFAHNIATVEQLRQRFAASGYRVVTITGADSPQEKDHKRLMFQPESGTPEADILVASDAAATGLNLQRGRWEVQYDTPDTAMLHAQRAGRIYRTGQKSDVELADLVADHPAERKARDRLTRKYALRELMVSPLEGLDDTGLAWFLHQRQVYKQEST